MNINVSPSSTSTNEIAKCVHNSPKNERKVEIRLAATTKDFHGGHLEGQTPLKSILKEVCSSRLDSSKNVSPKQSLTPLRTKSSPPSCNDPMGEQMVPTKDSSKIMRITKFTMKKSKARRAYSAVESFELKNRLRGGATIVAKLPYSRCLDGSKRRLHSRKQESTTRCSSDVVSMSSMTSTPRPQLFSLGSTQVRRTSSSGPSSSEKGCCSHQIRVRKREARTDSNTGSDAEMLVSAPRCRCADKNSVTIPQLGFSPNSTSGVMSTKPPTSVRITSQPNRALSIEDAIIQLAKRSISPPSDLSGSSSSSSKGKKLVHRTVSANRITDELRAKLGLTPPRKKNYCKSVAGNGGGHIVTSYKTSYERLMNGHAIGTQTLTLPRCYSDSHIDIMVKNKLRCSRCNHHCGIEQGSFTCDTCIEVHKVKNAFVLEIFADRAASTESKRDRTTCYGVRVGAGLLPVVVMFISLIICSVILLSDSVMSNVCGTYCTNSPMGSHNSPRGSLWSWFES